MPVLASPKHEAFAVGLFKGKSQIEAYAAAGYKPNDGHAARLAGNGRIQARIAELQREAAEKATDAISFDAIDMFKRLEDRIEAAAQAGDHKTAMDGTKFMIACFGYEDSPTLTHEHIKGKPLQTKEAEVVEKEQDTGTVLRFQRAIQAVERARKSV